MVKWIVDQGISQEANIVDVGCGNGSLLSALVSVVLDVPMSASTWFTYVRNQHNLSVCSWKTVMVRSLVWTTARGRSIWHENPIQRTNRQFHSSKQTC